MKKYTIIFVLILLTCITCSSFAFFKHKSAVKHTQAKKQTVERPNLKFERYNEFPGTQEMNLFGIEKKRYILSTPVISPDMRRVAYSEVYFYPQFLQTSSKLFYINVNLKSVESISVTLPPSQLAEIFAIKKFENPGNLILETGTDSLDSQLFRTLTIVDWSSDGRKLLVKETVGEYNRGIWYTNLWVYDFDIKKAKKLDEIKRAIAYYWRGQYKLNLNDYNWDIVPLGWDAGNPDMIVVNAYGYNNYGKEFLGSWGVDFRGKRSHLLSLDNQKWQVGKYGLVISGR